MARSFRKDRGKHVYRRGTDVTVDHTDGLVPEREDLTDTKGRRSIDFTKSADYEDAEDEDAGLRNEADYKRSQVRAALLFVLRFG